MSNVGHSKYIFCILYNISNSHDWVLEKNIKYYNKNTLIILKNVVL